MSLSANINDLVDALLECEAETGRACEASLNRAAKHVIIGSGSYPGAMQLTRRATKASIDLVSDAAIRGKVIAKLKRQGRLVGKTHAEISRLVKKERARRKSSIGYLAGPGYSNAAKAFGGTGVKGVQSGFARSAAAGGRGKKAKKRDLKAFLTNTAPASERIGFAALNQAVGHAADDLRDYTRRVLADRYRRHDGRRR